MSSPFQRAFSSKHPLKQNHVDSKVEKRPRFTSPTPVDPPSKKLSMMDIATGPIHPLLPAKRIWEKAKKIYHAVDTPEERTAIKNKIKKAWNIFKGPRSTRVGN